MRLKVLLLSLTFFTLLANADEKLPVLKVGSDVYSNVTITTVTARDIYFTSDKGMGNVKLKNLDSALQKHFNYNAAKAEAMDQKIKEDNAKFILLPPATNAVSPPPADSQDPDPKPVMDDAIKQVKAIINQPVTPLTRKPNAAVSIVRPGWFHPGAQKPNFNTVDIRTTQEFPYIKDKYVASIENPGLVFNGPDIEFNSMTKYFYTDRSLPKKKLSAAEMLEINRLYRIIGSCEKKLEPAK
ncbi:MAG: hypothetical protein JWQ71_817 [Pedosphaera sp.]|nr:hypothetical protein [Pedosphaera sp.]